MELKFKNIRLKFLSIVTIILLDIVYTKTDFQILHFE